MNRTPLDQVHRRRVTPCGLRTYIMVVAAITGVLQLPAAADVAKTGEVRKPTSQSVVPSNMAELSDEELQAAFLSGLDHGTAPSSADRPLLRWRGPIKIYVRQCRSAQNDPSLSSTLDDAVKEVAVLTGLSLSIVAEDAAKPQPFSRGQSIRLDICSLGPDRRPPGLIFHRGFRFSILPDLWDYEFGRSEAKHKARLRSSTYSGRRLIYGGEAGYRAHSGQIVEAQCIINYHYNRQYLHFDLPVDILRLTGRDKDARSILPDRFVNGQSFGGPAVRWGITAYDDQASPHLRDLRGILTQGQAAALNDECLRKDFDTRRRAIIDQCLSETLGYSWGAALSAQEERGTFGFHEKVEFLERDLFLDQRYRSDRYAVSRHYWPVFLKALYSPAIEETAGKSQSESVLANLAGARRSFDERPAPAENCTGLPQ